MGGGGGGQIIELDEETVQLRVRYNECSRQCAASSVTRRLDSSWVRSLSLFRSLSLSLVSTHTNTRLQKMVKWTSCRRPVYTFPFCKIWPSKVSDCGSYWKSLSLHVTQIADLSMGSLCGLVVRVLDYRCRGPGFDSRALQKKSSGSGTGSTQPCEYNWGATW
jgi:hypothetical protein